MLSCLRGSAPAYEIPLLRNRVGEREGLGVRVRNEQIDFSTASRLRGKMFRRAPMKKPAL